MSFQSSQLLIHNYKKSSRSMSAYLQDIRNVMDEFETAGACILDDKPPIKILSGLGPEYNLIYTAMKICITSFSTESCFFNIKSLTKQHCPNYFYGATSSLANFSPRNHRRG